MTSVQPFRFAVQATRATSGAEWREFARTVEGSGYTTLFVADHYLGPGAAATESRLPPQHLAPLTAMAVAAATTESLRVGCRVFCVDYHVPVVLAKEAATLDLLSDGRFEFGIGAGWSPHEYEAIGLEFAPAGRRVDKLAEVVALVKAHWAGDQLDVRGKHAVATGFAGLPRPVSRPHPALMIGGSKRRVLALAAREADVVSIANVPFDAVNEAGRTPEGEAVHRLGLVREGAGERFDVLEIETSPFFVRVTDDPGRAIGKVADLMAADPEVVATHPNVLLGSVDELVERLEERRERFGASYITVQQNEAERFAPVVDRLAGK